MGSPFSLAGPSFPVHPKMPVPVEDPGTKLLQVSRKNTSAYWSVVVGGNCNEVYNQLGDRPLAHLDYNN